MVVRSCLPNSRVARSRQELRCALFSAQHLLAEAAGDIHGTDYYTDSRTQDATVECSGRWHYLDRTDFCQIFTHLRTTVLCCTLPITGRLGSYGQPSIGMYHSQSVHRGTTSRSAKGRDTSPFSNASENVRDGRQSWSCPVLFCHVSPCLAVSSLV